MKAKQTTAFMLGGLGGLVAAAIVGLVSRFNLGRCCEDGVWGTTFYPKFRNVGTVKHLTILPLVEWYASAGVAKHQAPTGTHLPSLKREVGVSYLIRADGVVLLFDVGRNKRGEHPSPLLYNMRALGIPPEELDYVFISHLHPDHVGGTVCRQKHTFSISSEPLDLHAVTAYVPVPMTHPTAQVEVEEEPRVIAPGIITLGPIPRQLFFSGWTLEQVLVVNVEGKGIVLIIGCGHPTIEHIVDRAERLFDAPLYGVVGGLHYPATDSRALRLGLPMQRVVGTGKWPWDPINRQDVTAGIAYLQRRRPQLVALSSHDSCDWSLGAFRQAFGEAYRDLRVGVAVEV